MIAGRRAFQRGSHIETLTAILRDEPPELARTGQPSAAGPLEEIVAHCLEKSPDERFQSARDLVFALRVAERESLAVPSGRPDSAASAAVATGTGGEASHASIAVLPFRNMSADRDVEYFSDGMTEEIISALSKIEALRVASRTSAFAFKGKDEDVRKIGAALGVRSVLEGSVRQAGRKIRITAQLISVADGYHLWSEKFDREIEDVFAVQDEIARAIAETLKVRLLPAEATRLASRGTEDVGAYDDYLKGRYHFNRREPPEAIAEFERALAKDPGYTAACTGLADSYCIYGFYGGIDTLEALARARAAATKARELEPESADAHVSLALVDHYFAWDLDREELELRRAIELAPRSAARYSWLGLMLGLRDRTAEALELTHHAASLEPFSANVQTNVGWNLFGARRFDEALEEFGRALHIDPRAPYPLWASGLTCHLSGRHVEAVEFLERAAEVTGRKQPLYLALLGAAYAGAGRRPEAVALLEELRGRPASRYVPPLHLAFTYVALGETDEALSALDRACRERNGLTWYWVRDSAVFDALRSDSRFPSLLAKIVPA